MLAVSNTSPLRYLIAIEHANLLYNLFDRVLAPPGVAAELADPAAPPAVRDWIASPPAWFEVRRLATAPGVEIGASLDRGEAEAIQLASESAADVLVMDEWKGRSVARARGLPLIGALGVLGAAYQRRFIDDPMVLLANMRRHGFRASEQLVTGFASLLHTRYRRQS
jgi:predicted nucleic acid-binding protein